LTLPLLDEVKDGIGKHIILKDVNPFISFFWVSCHQYEAFVASFGWSFAVAYGLGVKRR
jgi:hypothetical protein